MKILGFNKLTVLDYPDTIAAIIFTGGCNFLCPFCHNPSLVLNPNSLSLDQHQKNDSSSYAFDNSSQPPSLEENAFSNTFSEAEILDYLSTRRNILGGLCISGGEPLLQPDLKDFVTKVKALGLRIKLDTNGYLPQPLGELIDEGLLDYVAMDIKGSPKGYSLATGLASIDQSRIMRSIAILRSSRIAYEFRITLSKELVSSDDLKQIGKSFGGSGALFLQNYQNVNEIINTFTRALPTLTPYSKEELQSAKQILLPFFDKVEIRNS